MRSMKKSAKSSTLFIIAALIVALFAGCSSSNNSPAVTEPPASTGPSESGSGSPQEPSTEPITFDMFVNFSWYSLKWSDPAAKNITDKTGVTLNITKPVSDDNQRMNIMLSNRELPDFVLMDKSNPALQRMIEGDMLYSLDELIDQYAPEMRDVLPKEALSNYKSADGKTYSLVSFIEGEQYQEAARKYNALISSNQGSWSIRQDYWEEIGKPDLGTPDAFIAALEQIQANHKDKIGFYSNTNNIPNSKHLTDPGVVRLGTAEMFGVQSLIKEGDSLKTGLRSPEYQELIKFLNRLASKDLLTKDSYIDSKDIFNQKINNGDAISYVFVIGEGTKVPADNPNTSYAVMEPFPTYKQVRDGSGWTAIAIPKANKNPERAIQFLSFLASEEGHELTKWGVEGETYVDAAQGPHYRKVDGKVTYLPEYWAEKQKDWSGIAEVNGLSEYWLAANSTWWNEPEWDDNDPQFAEYNRMFSNYVEYNPSMAGIMLDPTTPIGITEKKIIDLYSSYYARFIFADNEEAALALYAEFIDKAEQLGLADVEQAWTEIYNEKNKNR